MAINPIPSALSRADLIPSDAAVSISLPRLRVRAALLLASADDRKKGQESVRVRRLDLPSRCRFFHLIAAPVLGSFKPVQPAMAFVAAHADTDLSLLTLAKQAGASPFHLHRIFSASAGETPKHYTLRLRISRGAALLLTSDFSILEITLSCGFASQEAFTRAFRRRCDCRRGRIGVGDLSRTVKSTQGRMRRSLDTSGPAWACFEWNLIDPREPT
jgi:AraC-like DNA-binding protein